jgi:hypothetical protein
MSFNDQKNLVFVASAVAYIITGLPAFGLVIWLIIAYDDYHLFIYTKTNKGHNHKTLTALHFLSIWSSLIMGVDAFLPDNFFGWSPLIIRIILYLLVWFFNNSDDDWDDKLDRLKDAAKSVFWMGRWRSASTVSY